MRIKVACPLFGTAAGLARVIEALNRRALRNIFLFGILSVLVAAGTAVLLFVIFRGPASRRWA
jgi:phosphate/sulfate permease